MIFLYAFKSFINAFTHMDMKAWLIILIIPILKVYQFIRKRWRGGRR